MEDNKDVDLTKGSTGTELVTQGSSELAKKSGTELATQTSSEVVVKAGTELVKQGGTEVAEVTEKSTDTVKYEKKTSDVIDEDDAEFVGYFTLTHRPISISAEGLSKNMCKRISNHARLDESSNEYPVSAFLLAQIGKNYAIDNGSRITGKQLISLSLDSINGIRRLVGGGVVYLDCEDKPKLRAFYESDGVGFRLFGERVSEMDGIRYLHYLKIL